MPHESSVSNSDDIEFESIRCAFCFMDLTPLPLSRREAHYENHINDDANENAGGTLGFLTLS
jgi:hypothetical protein